MVQVHHDVDARRAARLVVGAAHGQRLGDRVVAPADADRPGVRVVARVADEI